MKPLSDQEIAALAAWLQGEQDFVLLETSRVTGEDHFSLLFTRPRRWLVCSGRDRAADFLLAAEELRRQGYFLAGWFGYEFGCLLEPALHNLVAAGDAPLAALGLFDAPFVVDHRRGGFRGAAPWQGRGPVAAQADRFAGVADLRTNIDCREYLRAVGRIKQYIAAGDTYQVNYTMKLKFGFSGSAASLYLALRRNQSVSYGAWIRQGGRDIMSFSPELFFRADRERITVRPMKGTMARGRTLSEDEQQRRALRHDCKNRCENVMIVDLLRNDLGHLLHGLGGGVVRPRSLFDVEVYETLLQMTSTLDGLPAARRQPGLDDMLRALFPCGSVTGAPKIRTMEIIHEQEKEPRGVYCGAIGYAGPETMVFNVPIRTLVLADGQGEMGIGSGIVHDSDPEMEWRESLLKGDFLTCPRPVFQLIETMLWRPGSGYRLLDEHLWRLTDSAAYFLFNLAIDEVRAGLDRQASRLQTAARVRLLLHRDGRVRISSTPLAEPPGPDPRVPLIREPLPAAVFSAQQTDPDDVYLYHKTTVRELYDLERQRAVDRGCYEVLFTNIRGEVTEGAISNIFIAGPDRLLTPPVASGLLAGTLRRSLLEAGRAVECVLTKQDVLAAAAVYTGNSVRGLVRVAVR